MTCRSARIIPSLLMSFLLLALAGIFSNSCLAKPLSQAKARFYQANTYYSEGKYDEAIKGYEGALNLGFESGNLYYNLANSYFKKGELGKAILNYEKAMRLIPRDSDLKSNYEYAKSLIKGGVVEAKAPWYRVAFNKRFSLFTIDGLAFSLAVIFTIILLVILGTIYFPAVRKYRIGALSVLIVIFALFSAALFEKASVIGKKAVIIAQKADAKFEPFDSATTHFTLYEGAEVAVVSPRDSWFRIERADKKRGWVKASDLEVF